MVEKEPLIVRHIGQLLTMSGENSSNAFSVLQDAAMVIVDDAVDWAGLDHDIPAHLQGIEVDVDGALVSPGLVDAHTHLLYAQDRAHEVRMRAEGRSYMEILEAGGGILSTVRHTRDATDEELLRATRRRLSRALLAGTTTVEMKSGYDLTVEGELRLLGLINRLKHEGPWRIVPTAMAAHAVPEEFSQEPAAFLDYLIQNFLPKVPSLVDVVDIFCEPGVFSVRDSRRYLQAAQSLGLQVKLHVDELADGGGAALAVELGALSADHCAFTSRAAFEAMAESHVAAVVLPGTAGYLNHGHMANARAVLQAGGWLAIGSDGNPGSSPTESLAFLMPWAASWLKLTPEEVWTAITRGGSAALGRYRVGRLDPGAYADFVVWEADHYAFPTYYYGTNLVREVYVGGRRVALNHGEVF